MLKKFELFMEEKKYHSIQEDKNNIAKYIIPFCISKFDELLSWAESRTLVKGSPLNSIIFEHINGKWNIILTMHNSSNESNRIIQGLLTKEYKIKAKEYKIKIKYVHYSGGHSPQENQFVQYDLNNDEIKTND